MPRETTKQQTGKPVLPAPTFKYSSSTYVVLAYAKLVKRPFSVRNVRDFTARFTRDSDVIRSLEVLERNGSVTRVNDGSWQVTPKGVQHVYDFALRRSPDVKGD